jgi:hypothetical protein
MAGADMFLGLSAAGILTKEMVKQMGLHQDVLHVHVQVKFLDLGLPKQK